MQIVVEQKLRQRRVVVACAVALAAILFFAIRYHWTFEYLVSRLAVLTVGAFFLGRVGIPRTRTLVRVVGLSVFEQGFLKTAAILWIGPPPGVEFPHPLALFTQMSIGAVAFLPVVLLFALGGYELSRLPHRGAPPNA